MSLICFKRWRRNRKQAVEEPIDPRIQQSRNPKGQVSDIDDAVVVPTKGFLGGSLDKGFLDGSLELPTYKPRFNPINMVSPFNWVMLTISDVLRTMSRDSYLARCVLFETARLQRRVFSTGSLKLSESARAVDMELITLRKVLDEGHELIGGRWDEEERKKQGFILQGEPFQQAIGTAKKSLRELEKTFNDQILGELKNGLESKESIDHGRLVGKVGNTHKELRQVYAKVINAYLEEEGKAREVAGDAGVAGS
ncbi:uncharacterized protein B0H64DRAFT_410200 [Chaetomium fimeti]|uniref:Uncharacterized protein n=1 Tax=Chaetomium fimeti TaxID=1854472 RepID=A0AAE0H7R1_9PEZI|nr:hypothetical protein B0H64DRAFT_410200 [Chaetomium fimeti]